MFSEIAIVVKVHFQVFQALVHQNSMGCKSLWEPNKLPSYPEFTGQELGTSSDCVVYVGMLGQKFLASSECV